MGQVMTNTKKYQYGAGQLKSCTDHVPAVLN